MKISTFFYSLRQGMKNIFRNKIFSLASIATMSACIFLFGLFFIVVMTFQGVVKEAESSVAVTVFFQKGTTDEQIQEIEQQVKKRVEVSQIQYISADDAWSEFQKEYLKDAEELAEGFADDNPLADSASLEIYLNDVSMQDALVTYLESMEGIREVNYSDFVADTLTDFNLLVGYISAAIVVILLFVAIFLISNTVSIGIAVRKEEIAIMKLIGATDFFVKAPFIVEGLLIGFIGSCIPLLLLFYLYQKLIVYIPQEFSFLSGMLQFLSVQEIFGVLVPAGLLLGVGIGFAGSFLTIRKHLRV